MITALIAATSLAGCAISKHSASISANERPASEQGTYQVSYDLEYGYVFEREGGRFFPTIAESELSKFDVFFSDGHLMTIVSKHVYCECNISSMGSQRRVEKATLYAR